MNKKSSSKEEKFPLPTFGFDTLNLNIKCKKLDLEKIFISIEDFKEVTNIILTKVQKCLWEFCRKNREHYEFVKPKIFEYKFIGIKDLKNGLTVSFKISAPFTVRIEASAIRLANDSANNINARIMSQQEFSECVENCLEFAEKIIDFVNDELSNQNAHNTYSIDWINLVKQNLEKRNVRFTRLDVNTDLLISDKRARMLVEQSVKSLADNDSANYEHRGTINNNSFFLKPKLKNRPHISTYDKYRDSLHKIEELESEIESLWKSLKGKTNLNFRAYTVNKIKTFSKELKKFRKNLKNSKDVYRIELRYFNQALRKAFGSFQIDEVLKKDIPLIFLNDLERIFGKLFDVSLLEHKDRLEIDTLCAKGRIVTPDKIIHLLTDKSTAVSIPELADHFSYELIKYGQDFIPFEKLGGYNIFELNKLDPKISENAKGINVKNSCWKELKNVSEVTVRKYIRLLEKLNFVTRCKGNVALTGLCKEYLNLHPFVSKFLFRFHLSRRFLGCIGSIDNVQELKMKPELSTNSNLGDASQKKHALDRGVT